MWPYLRQVAGQLLLGSIAGCVFNLAVVLPAVLLGRAIDAVLVLEQGGGSSGEVRRRRALSSRGPSPSR